MKAGAVSLPVMWTRLLLRPSFSLYVYNNPQAVSDWGTLSQQHRVGIPELKASFLSCHSTHTPVTRLMLVSVTSFSFRGSLLPH